MEDLKNYFEGKKGHSATGDSYRGTQPFLNVRNADSARTRVFEIELRSSSHSILAEFQPKEEDQIPLALSILGVGRVNDEVEHHAADLLNTGRTEEDFLRFAVINLRAALLLREQKAKETAELAEQAYALYKLAYPKTNIEFAEFVGASVGKFWVQNLKNIRKDPTVLGSL